MHCHKLCWLYSSNLEAVFIIMVTVCFTVTMIFLVYAVLPKILRGPMLFVVGRIVGDASRVRAIDSLHLKYLPLR